MTLKPDSNHSRNAADGAALVCCALALSYLEAIIPVSLLIPIPGFKLGLANIVVILAFYRNSPSCALSVSACRVVLSSLLFGSLASFAFSISGAAFSFASLLLTAYALRGKVSFIGVSVLSALAHNIGQAAAAVIMLRSFAVLFYFPALVISALITGIITGAVLLCLPERIFVRRSISR